jgi:ABC-2 type transport system permease protein
MSLRRVVRILEKDLRLGPRSPLLLWALLLPIALTLLLQGVFGALFDPEPRLGVVDLDDSQVLVALRDLDGMDVRRLDDVGTLRREVAAGRLDAGLELPRGFDTALQDGQHPPLRLSVAGESLPADRAVVTVAVLDAVRDVAGQQPRVDVQVIEVGDAGLPLELRLLPLLVLYAAAVPGGMVPAASLVEEKERGTIQALLASPVSPGDVVMAKGALGLLLGVLAGTVTLALNDAFGVSPAAMVLAVTLGSLMMAEVGLLLGTWARDTNTLFASWKAGGLLLFLPAFFFIWPDLPTWPARLLPTYYFLAPAYEVGVEGAGLADVAGNLAVAGAVCLLLLPAVALAASRMGRDVAGGDRRVRPSASSATPAPS